MSANYRVSRPRGPLAAPLALVDDFMNWFLFGYETWLVALLKGVPLFIYVYFLLTYVPNYVYYLVTQYIPFLKFSDSVGFLLAAIIAGGNFTALIVLCAVDPGGARPTWLRLVADPRPRLPAVPRRGAAAHPPAALQPGRAARSSRRRRRRPPTSSRCRGCCWEPSAWASGSWRCA